MLFKKIIVSCILLFSLLVYSCNQEGQKGTEQKYIPGLHIQPGLKYYYTITNETETQFEVNNKKIENSNSTLVGLFYEIIQDSTNDFLLKLTFDSLHIKIQKGDNIAEMDAANTGFSIDPVERLLGALKGSSLLMSIDSKGGITATSGNNELVEKIMAGISGVDEAQKVQIRTQLNSLFGEAFIKNNLESLSIFPDSALFVGDSWMKDQTEGSELKLKLTTKYTLTSVDDSIASIDAVSDIDNANTKTNMLGTEVIANLKGDQEGNYKIDMQTGLLLTGKSNTSMEGSLQIMGRDVPIKMKIIKTVSSKKL